LFDFQPLFRREVTVRFDGGTITSDAGGLLLREIEAKTQLLAELARCFDDFRDPEVIEHTAEELIKQRVFALALGYEDLNDHDQLRADPLLATLVGRRDVTGQERLHLRDQDKPLAGKSTLNRLELTPVRASEKSRYKKIVARHKDIEQWFVRAFLQLHSQPPEEIVLDLDATDDPIHGHQPGRFFHGYYDSYCYLPLYVFCGEQLLVSYLRPSRIDESKHAGAVLKLLVKRLRAAWPTVRLIVRGDSGFCRRRILAWCERNDVHYVLGLAKNSRLNAMTETHRQRLARQFAQSQVKQREFSEFRYGARTWKCERRVIARLEHMDKGDNPRYIVTNLEGDARSVYEDVYCARGEMENRIKEAQLGLFADRTSCQYFAANQFRLLLSSLAYILTERLRSLALAGTEFARLQAQTLRAKLLKIGAVILRNTRRVRVMLSSAFPYQAIYLAAARALDSP
jgi:hypothetical protein